MLGGFSVDKQTISSNDASSGTYLIHDHHTGLGIVRGSFDLVPLFLFCPVSSAFSLSSYVEMVVCIVGRQGFGHIEVAWVRAFWGPSDSVAPRLSRSVWL